jgi:hypothetical protein
MLTEEREDVKGAPLGYVNPLKVVGTNNIFL